MFGIVDDIYSDRQISGSPARVLFLSARQTELIANDRTAIHKMIIDGFKAPTPGMVIQLLFSAGFDSLCPSDKEMNDMTDRLDRLMAEVIIPLAAENHAVVFTSADRRCGLSEAFTRVTSLMRTKWGDTLPFTVISVVPDLFPLYTNPNPAAHWRKVRDSSSAWGARSPLLRKLANAEIAKADATPGAPKVPVSDADLNVMGSNFLVFDRSSETEWEGHSSEMCNSLLHAMRTYLTSDAEGLGLPSLAFKAGNACFLGLKNSAASAQQYATTLQPALDVLQGGTPLLLIDCFERPPIPPEVKQRIMDNPALEGEERRQQLFEWAKAEYIKAAEQFRAGGQSYNHDIGTLAYFLDVLKGDGEAATIETAAARRKATGNKRIPLGLAIHYHETGKDPKGGATLPPATPEQMLEAMEWLAEVSLEEDFHTWRLQQLHELAKLEPKAASQPDAIAHKKRIEGLTWEAVKASGSYEKYVGADTVRQRLSARVAQARVLLKEPSCNGINLHANHAMVYKLCQEMVQLDRLPTKNSYEALCLLRQAWDEHDITTHLARRYKLIAKGLYYLQLALAFSIVFLAQVEAGFGHLANLAMGSGGTATSASSSLQSAADSAAWVEIIFVLAVLSSFLISFEGFLNAKPKWRQMRAKAGTLQSWIWCFRARVKPFDVAVGSRPEDKLHANLVSWRNGLGSTADLNVSTLRKKYKQSVFRHHQHLPMKNGMPDENGKTAGKPLTDFGDDHYAPIRATEYIQFRLRPQIAWYQVRIPRSNLQRVLLKFLGLGVTVASSILARYSYIRVVVVATAFGSALQSYSEYNDTAKKVERYNRAIAGLENLLTWWESLSRVERGSEHNIAKLVHSGEQCISDERLAWQSTSSNGRDDDGVGHEALEAGGPSSASNKVAPGS